MNKLIRVALVEDDEAYREKLMTYLQQFGQEHQEEMHITSFCDGEEIISKYRTDYDIILMDIEMAHVDGMTAAEHIRQSDSDVVIIFITNTPQYAMKGYTVDALDYVLKPINYFAFSQRISRALTRMQKRTSRSIVLHERSRMVKVSLSDIKYVEVRNHDLTYHTTKDTIDVKGTLSEAETQLVDDHFFRISNSFLVNLKYIDCISGYDLVIGEDTLNISRSRKKLLLDALNNYLNEVSL